MSLIALPPVDQELPEPEGQEIDAGPFWPEQDTAQLRALAQLGGEVSEDRFREAALNAIIAVTRDLEDWRAAQVAAGYASLDAVPAQQVNGESAKIILFRRALLATIRADLAEVSRDFDATAAGDQRSARLEDVINDQRRNARWAIRDLIGRPRNTVELI